jgi:predicted secreted protein
MRMVWAVLGLAGLAALAAAKKDARGDQPVSADAVWKPEAQFVESIRKACAESSDPAGCLAEKMAAVAPPAAVAFTRSIHNEGWLRDFRKVARVDIAYVEYPFRANQNQGWLLVNGSPPLLDVDNLPKLPKSEMEENRAWSQLIARSPQASLFPGDRNGATDPLAILYPDGSEEFVAAWKVLDGCPACAQLGIAFLGFQFNPKGKLTATEFIEFVPAASDGPPARPVHIRAGQKFTLALKGDARHEWTLAQEPARWILRSVNQSAGNQSATVFWTFEAISNGSTQMTLRYSSLDSPETGESLVLRVTAAPGLGHDAR